jgi:serine protease Do
MTMWKTAALTAALMGAAGAGGSLSPAAEAQGTRVAPRAVQVFGGSGSRIGVSIEDVDPSDAKAGQAGGVRIAEVTDEGPAAKAGIRRGDVVVEFDGERVRSARQFTRLVQETVAGRKVQVAILRDGQRSTLTVEPTDQATPRLFDEDGLRVLEDFGRFRVTPRPNAPYPPTRAFPDIESFIWRANNVLGITVDDLSPQLADYFGTKDGVLVTSVDDDSAAGKAGLKAGDVITSFNGSAVTASSELRRRIQEMSSGAEFSVGVMRDKKSLTVKGKTEERRDRRRTFRSVV